MVARTVSSVSLAGLLVGAALLAAPSQSNVRLDVMSSGGFTAAYVALSADFSKQTGIALSTVYGASMGGAPSSIPSRLNRGEAADVVILAREGLDLLARARRLFPDRVGVIEGERTWTYREYAQRCDRLAHALDDLGLTPAKAAE